ncbi:MAG: hypothetical protein NT002_00940 [candidate division Zixibacteria bacterium]|nr:hypothetical protein [candidate division Zixibacteria bacterium]
MLTYKIIKNCVIILVGLIMASPFPINRSNLAYAAKIPNPNWKCPNGRSFNECGHIACGEKWLCTSDDNNQSTQSNQPGNGLNDLPKPGTPEITGHNNGNLASSDIPESDEATNCKSDLSFLDDYSANQTPVNAKFPNNESSAKENASTSQSSADIWNNSPSIYQNLNLQPVNQTEWMLPTDEGAFKATLPDPIWGDQSNISNPPISLLNTGPELSSLLDDPAQSANNGQKERSQQFKTDNAQSAESQLSNDKYIPFENQQNVDWFESGAQSKLKTTMDEPSYADDRSELPANKPDEVNPIVRNEIAKILENKTSLPAQIEITESDGVIDLRIKNGNDEGPIYDHYDIPREQFADMLNKQLNDNETGKSNFVVDPSSGSIISSYDNPEREIFPLDANQIKSVDGGLLNRIIDNSLAECAAQSMKYEDLLVCGSSIDNETAEQFAMDMAYKAANGAVGRAAVEVALSIGVSKIGCAPIAVMMDLWHAGKAAEALEVYEKGFVEDGGLRLLEMSFGNKEGFRSWLENSHEGSQYVEKISGQDFPPPLIDGWDADITHRYPPTSRNYYTPDLMKEWNEAVDKAADGLWNYIVNRINYQKWSWKYDRLNELKEELNSPSIQYDLIQMGR